jgi:hypothetical protein
MIAASDDPGEELLAVLKRASELADEMFRRRDHSGSAAQHALTQRAGAAERLLDELREKLWRVNQGPPLRAGRGNKLPRIRTALPGAVRCLRPIRPSSALRH